MAYLRKLIAKRTYDSETEFYFNTFIQGIVADCQLFDMVEDIEDLYDQKRIDPDIYGDFDEFMIWMQDEDKRRVRVKYVDDVIKEMHWWACFQDPEEKKVLIKVGRNDPCPCGSGGVKMDNLILP